MMRPKSESKKSANNYAQILNAIHNVGVTQSGEAIGKDGSFISRLKSNEKKITINEFVELLTVWDLELVEASNDKVHVDRVLYQALLELSHKQIHNAGSADAERISVSRGIYTALVTFARIGVSRLGKPL